MNPLEWLFFTALYPAWATVTEMITTMWMLLSTAGPGIILFGAIAGVALGAMTAEHFRRNNR